jgi:hypothetical protein
MIVAFGGNLPILPNSVNSVPAATVGAGHLPYQAPLSIFVTNARAGFRFLTFLSENRSRCQFPCPVTARQIASPPKSAQRWLPALDYRRSPLTDFRMAPGRTRSLKIEPKKQLQNSPKRNEMFTL